MNAWAIEHYYLAASLAALAIVFACGSWTHLSRLLVAIVVKRCETEELDQIRRQVESMSQRLDTMAEGNGFMSERVDVVSRRVDLVEEHING
jgi:hypothetical protein